MKLADMQAQCQPSFRTPWVLSSCRQPFVSEAFSIYREDETVESRQRVLRHSSRVQAKCNLVHVAANVLRAHLMPRPIDAALEQRPDAFDGVCVDVALRIFTVTVVDGAVIEPQTIQTLISTRLICTDQRAGFYVGVKIGRAHV